jgi:ribosomal-protein-alanine N-acetyltransferase
VKFTFNKMKLEDAHQIASWHYEAPYDFYDWDRDAADLAELLNPQSWQEAYYSVLNGENELVGFLSSSETAKQWRWDWVCDQI